MPAADASPTGTEMEAGVAPGTATDPGSLSKRVRAIEERLIEEKAVVDKERRESEKLRLKVKELAAAIQLSGFFDVSASTFDNNPNLFELGSFEFDLKKDFNKYFQVGAALVFQDSKADLAVGFIDLHLFGGLIPARGNIFLESGFHIQAGRFDVPFGNDWVYFATLDRPTMSAPLTTESLMSGGYNDVGLRVLGNQGFVNYVGYILEGVGEGVAVGGRLAFIPFNNPFTMKSMDAQPLDIGASYLRDYGRDGAVEAELLAFDVETRYEFLRLQTEYYRRRDRLVGERWTGYQGSLFATFLEETDLPFGVGLRGDEVRMRPIDGGATDRLVRGTAATFLRAFEVTVLKLEFSHFFVRNAERHGDTVFAQLVIGFK